jgi:hypothetical protein
MSFFSRTTDRTLSRNASPNSCNPLLPNVAAIRGQTGQFANIESVAVLAEMSHPGKPDRALSPGSMSEDERRELIARQRSALYADSPYTENGGYVDDIGTTRPGAPGLTTTSATHRGPSPLAYDYGRAAPEASAQGVEASQGSRADSPQSNGPNGKGPFDNAVQRTSNSSPGVSPSRQGVPGQAGNAVAPIGTRPSGAQGTNSAMGKRSTTPLRSPLSRGYSASGNGDENGQSITSSGTPSNPPSATPDGYNGWGNRPWGKQPSGLGVQASVWG